MALTPQNLDPLLYTNKYLTRDNPYRLGMQKFKKSGNHMQSVRENPDPEFQIPENFGFEIFLKSHFRGGICYMFFSQK